MQSKYKLLITPLAASDIESALEYIAVNLCNGKAAEDLYFKIEKAFEKIRAFPYSSADCSLYLISDKNIRHVIVDNYILVFEVKEDIEQINILRFRYGKMDMTKMNIGEAEDN